MKGILTVNILQESREDLNHRAFSPLSHAEVALLAFNVGLGFIFLKNWLNGYPGFFDFFSYLDAASGNFQGFYYAHWILPLFRIMNQAPMVWIIGLWSLINLIGVFIAGRVFGNRTIYILSTYQLFYTLFYGQIMGVIIGGLAIFWWCLKNGKPLWAGLGLSMASVKYHIGIPVAVILLFLGEYDRKKIFQALAVPVAVYMISLMVDPSWPFEVVANIRSSPPDTMGNISLWQWLGPACLLLWLPATLIPMKKMWRLVLLVATLSLTLPYFQQTDLLGLYVFPVGFLSWLGNIGFLFIIWQWEGLKLITLAPMIISAVIIYQSMKDIQTKRSAF